MRFKRLEIFGFKSFANKTVLDFEGGVTAIVGPNGCGKSNVFDSIRWVLGEQSIKELRGSTREDVIFNGTQTQAALGFAEVSLTLSNEDKRLETDFEEVTITRRLFRSGESEYLLNKVTVRLKDIQALLMGTGIGAETYSLIQQGKIDTVVSARPEERRLLLDEASGITKYKVKKRESLNKLKATDENLLRVNDIVTEVKRQIVSTERQANKARQYKVEFEKLKQLEIYLAKYQMSSIERKKNEMHIKVNEILSQKINITEEFEESSEHLTNELNCLENVEQNINTLNTDQIKISSQIDINERQINFNKERLQGLDDNESKLAKQKEQLKSRCEQQKDRIKELKASILHISESTQEHKQEIQEKSENLENIENSVTLAYSKIEDEEKELISLSSKQANTRNQFTENMKELQGALARKKRLVFELDKVQEEKGEIENKHKKLNERGITLSGQINLLKVTKGHKRKLLDYLITSLKNLIAELDEIEKRKLLTISQKDFIEKLHGQYDDNPEKTIEGRLLTKSIPHGNEKGIIGKIKEIIKPLSDERDSESCYTIICESKFIELDPEHIAERIHQYDIEIIRLEEDKKTLSQKISTLESDFGRLDQRISDKETSYSVLSAQRNDIASETGKLEGEIGSVFLEVDEIKSTIETLKENEEHLNDDLNKITKEIDSLKGNVKEKQEILSKKAMEREDLNVAMVQVRTELESYQEKIHDAEANEVLHKEVLDGCLEEIKNIDSEVLTYLERKQKFQTEMETLIDIIENFQNDRESLKTSLSEFEAEKEEVGLKINSSRSRMKSIEDELDNINGFLHSQELGSQELNFKEQSIKDKLSQSYKIAYDEVLKIIEKDTLNQEPLCLEEGPPKENIEHPQANQKKEDTPSIQDFTFDPETAPQEIRKLRKRCDSYGHVNLVAIEEYEEMKERFSFLTQQQADLLESKSKLMSTINTINRSTRKMFLETFEKVDTAFRELFKLLFGGGEAQLVLLDPENVLESGIDIIARPLGKKLQNISLLSGGERTMAAIALIFGVFKVKPSPFCVLDEIDAALDESNVDRFSKLLKQFSEIAQFVVITHNKKTIAVSDVLYGVTMPENGISRLVSVKFNKSKEPQKELINV